MADVVKYVVFENHFLLSKVFQNLNLSFLLRKIIRSLSRLFALSIFSSCLRFCDNFNLNIAQIHNASNFNLTDLSTISQIRFCKISFQMFCFFRYIYYTIPPYCRDARDILPFFISGI